jgi:capsular polysaccharide biosynthesis protein
MPQPLLGTAVLLAACSDDNYYHWLFDSLPRLHLLELAGYAVSDVDHFLLKRDAFPFQIQSLAPLGLGQCTRPACPGQRQLWNSTVS